MFASGWAASETDLAASLTSHSERFAPAGYREQDRARTVDRRLEQRRGDGLHRSLGGTVLANAHADPEQRVAGLAHDRAHVREVEVDQPRERHEVRDPLHALAQHVVGHAEGLHHRSLLVEHRQQPVVGDDDQRVHLAGERAHALLGLVGAARPLKAERLGDDRHGERADFAGDPRDHRRGAGARPAARSGGDEDHVGALQHAP